MFELRPLSSVSSPLQTLEKWPPSLQQCCCATEWILRDPLARFTLAERDSAATPLSSECSRVIGQSCWWLARALQVARLAGPLGHAPVACARPPERGTRRRVVKSSASGLETSRRPAPFGSSGSRSSLGPLSERPPVAGALAKLAQGEAITRRRGESTRAHTSSGRHNKQDVRSCLMDGTTMKILFAKAGPASEFSF